MTCQHTSARVPLHCGECVEELRRGLAAERAAYEQTKADYEKERGAHRGTASVLLATTNRLAALEAEIAQTRTERDKAIDAMLAATIIPEVKASAIYRLRESIHALQRQKADLESELARARPLLDEAERAHRLGIKPVTSVDSAAADYARAKAEAKDGE